MIMKILHDPSYVILWELWYCSTLRSCRFSCRNNKAHVLRSPSPVLGACASTPYGGLYRGVLWGLLKADTRSLYPKP